MSLLSTQHGLSEQGFDSGPLIRAHINGKLLGNVLCIPFSVPSSDPCLTDQVSVIGTQCFHDEDENKLCKYNPTQDQKIHSTSVTAAQFSRIIFNDIIQTLLPFGNSYLSHPRHWLDPQLPLEREETV